MPCHLCFFIFLHSLMQSLCSPLQPLVLQQAGGLKEEEDAMPSLLLHPSAFSDAITMLSAASSCTATGWRAGRPNRTPLPLSQSYSHTPHQGWSSWAALDPAQPSPPPVHTQSHMLSSYRQPHTHAHAHTHFDPWEAQQQRLADEHAFKNELLLRTSLEECMHPVSRSARLVPETAQPLYTQQQQQPSSNKPHHVQQLQQSQPQPQHVQDGERRRTAVGQQQQVPPVTASSAHQGQDTDAAVGQNHSSSSSSSSSSGSKSSRSSSGSKSSKSRRSRREAGPAADLDVEALCAALQSRDTATLMQALGPR